MTMKGGEERMLQKRQGKTTGGENVQGGCPNVLYSLEIIWSGAVAAGKGRRQTKQRSSR